MKKLAFGVLVTVFVLGALAVGNHRGFAAEADAPVGVVERTLFATNGENSVRVCYDSYTWETYPTDTEKENWKWYSEEEFAAHIEHLQFQKDGGRDPEWGKCCGIYSSLITASENGAERDFAKLNQTLTDIKNGIKVSKPKTIFITRDPHDTSALVGWAQWYCYGYTVKDPAGKEVDLGPFETRDELFSALRQYYDKEIAAGALKKAEADGLYNKVAHQVRNVDEAPIAEKLLNYRQLYLSQLFNPFYFES